jgi:hypothetical protein
LLNNFSVSNVAKLVDYSKGMIFHIPQMIIKRIQQLFSTFIISISKRTQALKLLTIDSNLAKQSSKDSPGF